MFIFLEHSKQMKYNSVFQILNEWKKLKAKIETFDRNDQ